MKSADTSNDSTDKGCSTTFTAFDLVLPVKTHGAYRQQAVGARHGANMARICIAVWALAHSTSLPASVAPNEKLEAKKLGHGPKLLQENEQNDTYRNLSNVKHM